VAAASGGARDRALAAASDAANAVQAETRRIAQGFQVEGTAGRVGEEVRELLEAPSGYVDRVVATLPAAEVNQAGRSFCRQFREVTSRYPFSPGASRGASVEEVDGIFKPGGSALWAFYEDRVRQLLSVQGSRYAARAGANPSPTSGFVQFFNDAAAVSDALYASPDAPGPALRFALRLEATEALPEVTIHVDGQVGRFTQRNVAQKTLRWEAARAENAYVTGVLDGREVTLLEAPNGTWALFRLFQRATWEQRAPGEYRLAWPIPGQQVTLRGELLLQSRVPILNPAWLSGLDCVSTIAR
jgi:type VI protein secretion system component VasK